MDEQNRDLVGNWLEQLVFREVWTDTKRWLRAEQPQHLRGMMSASDLIMSAYREALKNAAQLRGERSGERDAWFRAIAKNKLRNAIRKFSSGKRDVFRERDGVVDGLAGESVELRNEIRIYVQEVLDRLSPKSLETIQLKYMEHLTRREMAERLGISLGQAANRLRTAIEEFRNLTHETENDETGWGE